MTGTRAGGYKAAVTNKARHGENFYSRIGRIGGQRGHTGGFASSIVGADGLTGRERARVVGVIGGRTSTRRGIKNGEGKNGPMLATEEV